MLLDNHKMRVRPYDWVKHKIGVILKVPMSVHISLINTVLSPQSPLIPR